MYNAIIVDDDPKYVDINNKNLRRFKEIKTIEVFRTSHEALAYAKHRRPDLIILDYHMPEMDGLTFISELRNEHVHSEVIVISMDNDPEVIQSFYEYGVVDYILKGFQATRFNEAIYTFLERVKRKRVVSPLSCPKQEEIDVIYRYKPLCYTIEAKKETEKGIKKETCERLLTYLKMQTDRPLTLKQIINNVPLSKVTIRRYMNFFTKKGLVTVTANYATGGRPSLIYTYKNDTGTNTFLKYFNQT